MPCAGDQHRPATVQGSAEAAAGAARRPAVAGLEVQVGPRRATGVADVADDLPLAHGLAHRHGEAALVPVERGHATPVVEHHGGAVAVLGPGHRDRAGLGRPDRRADRSGDVEAGVQPTPARAELRGDRTPGGPHAPAAAGGACSARSGDRLAGGARGGGCDAAVDQGAELGLGRRQLVDLGQHLGLADVDAGLEGGVVRHRLLELDERGLGPGPQRLGRLASRLRLSSLARQLLLGPLQLPDHIGVVGHEQVEEGLLALGLGRIRGLDHLDEAELRGTHEGVDRSRHQIRLQVADGAARDSELGLELGDVALGRGGGTLRLVHCRRLHQHAGAEGAERCLQVGLGRGQHVEVGLERGLAPAGVLTLRVDADGAGGGDVGCDQGDDQGEDRDAYGAAVTVHQGRSRGLSRSGVGTTWARGDRRARPDWP
ncbi:MAG: hypothetical protein AVDCRST_MAG20-855 [uncultured Acidimicrobiales bacterium]|uniref:Uncharacterized protein n=1 Tax=uncultured Acidimicrobiales bacterium TaxID=310071 RepID=A0A6J4HFZ4_9ACTN|nr:MAG: hypothetical protein AVDCRST_MAG20-855 [uncultured Acidimicrobiales bacterium]